MSKHGIEEFHRKRRAAAQRRSDHGRDGEGKPKKKSAWKRFFLRFFLFLFITMLLLAGIGYGLFVTITSPHRKMADKFNLEDINNLDHPCIIYDRNGEEIGRIFDENRSYVPIDQISPNMINALIAQEDKTFWEHKGYDPVGILRAGKEAIMAGGKANQGASTVTQQLARNAYDLESRIRALGGNSYERKMVEIFLAIRIEEKYDKRQILEFYLNRINFGRGFYGIRAASLGYFGKEPIDLSVREAASIAALVKNPLRYNPISNPEVNFEWRNDVIDRMQRSNYLTYQEAERLKKLPLELNPKPLRRNTSFLYAQIQEKAMSLFAEQRGEEIIKSKGLKIYTTIDKAMQDTAEASLQQQLLDIENHEDYQNVRYQDAQDPRSLNHRYLDGVVYAIDNKTGGVLAYVAGRDFSTDNFDIIQSGRRPAGTSMLPFLYACAFENNKSPTSRLIDDAMDNRMAGIGGSEGILGEWGMELKRGRYLKNITTRQGLAWSKIAASARLGVDLGAMRFIKTLTNWGITPPKRNPNSVESRPEYYPRVYLGTEPVSIKEMVQAYSSIPRLGTRPLAPYIISKVTDSHGKILWEEPLAINPRSIKSTTPCTAYRLHSILKDSLTEGCAQRVLVYLPNDFKGGVKTGTNYDFADNSLYAYNSSITCGIWIGYLNTQSSILPNAFSSDTCAPILGNVLRAASTSFPDEEIPIPSDTEAVQICKSSGQRATNFCFHARGVEPSSPSQSCTYTEYFPKGDVSLSSCVIHGDGSPSLADFIDPNAASLTIKPYKPILPKEAALIGEDPYGTDLKLNPRYKDGIGLSSVRNESSGLPEADVDDEVAEEAETVIIDSELELAPPRLMRIPILPLPL